MSAETKSFGWLDNQEVYIEVALGAALLAVTARLDQTLANYPVIEIEVEGLEPKSIIALGIKLSDLKFEQGSPVGELLEYLGLTQSLNSFGDYIVRLDREEYPWLVNEYQVAIDVANNEEGPFLYGRFGANPSDAYFTSSEINLGKLNTDLLAKPRLELMYDLVESMAKSLEGGAKLLPKEQVDIDLS